VPVLDYKLRRGVEELRRDSSRFSSEGQDTFTAAANLADNNIPS
jgi:hypothetical protein